MSYAIRNTLVLAAFLLVIFSVGSYLTSVQQPGQIRKLQKESSALDAVIAQRPSLEVELKASQEKLADMEMTYSHRFKVIPTNDTTALTYAYLNTIMNSSGLVKFNMLYQGPKTFKDYGYNVYNLQGEASYDNLFKFIWYLEHAKLLYKISSLTLTSHEVRDDKTGAVKLVVPFTMDLDAYYSSVAGVSSQSHGEDPTLYKTVYVGWNYLRPLISSEPPPNVLGLVDVETAELRAVMPDKIFIVDDKGVGHILRVGDQVYLGYLTKIDPNQNEAEFTLNNGGIIKHVTLKVRFGK